LTYLLRERLEGNASLGGSGRGSQCLKNTPNRKNSDSGYAWMCGGICEFHGGTCLHLLAIVRVETALDKGRETSLTVMGWRAAHAFFVGRSRCLRSDMKITDSWVGIKDMSRSTNGVVGS